MTKIIVMLLWVGGVHGGPATITGFETVEACQEAMPIVQKGYLEIWGSNNPNWVQARCVELPRGVKPMSQP